MSIFSASHKAISTELFGFILPDSYLEMACLLIRPFILADRASIESLFSILACFKRVENIELSFFILIFLSVDKFMLFLVDVNIKVLLK